jgi:hypothetical protein
MVATACGCGGCGGRRARKQPDGQGMGLPAIVTRRRRLTFASGSPLQQLFPLLCYKVLRSRHDMHITWPTATFFHPSLTPPPAAPLRGSPAAPRRLDHLSLDLVLGHHTTTIAADIDLGRPRTPTSSRTRVSGGITSAALHSPAYLSFLGRATTCT